MAWAIKIAFFSVAVAAITVLASQSIQIFQKLTREDKPAPIIINITPDMLKGK